MPTALADLHALMHAVEPHSPSGDDLAYTDSYAEMERLAHGRSEQQYGKTIFDAQEPDWKSLQEHALELAACTHDLRVGVYLTQGLIRTCGIGGMADGLELLACWLTHEWETLHPALDPEDGPEALERSNILLELCDYERTLRGLLQAPLAVSPDHGDCTLHDVRTARSDRRAEHLRRQLTLLDIQVIFAAVDRSAVETTRADVVRAEQSLVEIVGIFEEKTGTSPNLEPIAAMLKEIRGIIDEMMPDETVQQPKASVSTAFPMGNSVSSEADGPAAGVPMIGSRRDVVATLDALCDYYSHNEPSSPVPLILRRARRLVEMDFVDIVRNLAPDGLADVSRWVGSLDSGDEN